MQGKGNSIELDDCKKHCPEWSPWGNWSSCTRTCDSGHRYRQRYCLMGTDCEGPHDLREDCNTDPCAKTAEKNCVDNYTFCAAWEKQSYCNDQYASWMTVNCPLSCGICNKQKVELCKDEYDVSCGRWQNEGKCDVNNQQIRSFVREKCRRSCKLCGAD